MISHAQTSPFAQEKAGPVVAWEAGNKSYCRAPGRGLKQSIYSISEMARREWDLKRL